MVNKQYLTSARQRRYAMDLCEVCPEILHRVGPQPWIPDMLSRPGYPADETRTEDERLMRANKGQLESRMVGLGYPRQDAALVQSGHKQSK